METIAEDIGKFGLVSAIIIVAVLLIKGAIFSATSDEISWGDYGTAIINYLIIGVTVVVVAIPEGLPLAVTLSLAFSVKKMLYDNNLVR